MSVVKYIGRTTYFKGKTLWEIVGNLKNYGVGRIIVRSRFQQYPEPSFMKIVKVETAPNDIVYIKHASGINVPQSVRRVKVFVEKVFRGNEVPGQTLVYRTSYKPDYQLIPKDEEEKYCNVAKPREIRTVTPYFECPPLLKEMILRDHAKKGTKPPEEFRLIANLQRTKNNKYVKDLNSTETLPINIGNMSTPQLYKDVILNE